MANDTVHASALVMSGYGVLIRGASGSGKSSLLVSLLDRDAAAILVADDRVELEAVNGVLFARTPPAIAGLLEVRGVGVMRRAYKPHARIDLVADLVPLADSPRLPDGSQRVAVVSGVMLRRIFIAAGSSDGAARVTAALTGIDS